MKFVSAKPLVEHARDNSYAVPALNTNGGSYDIARAALEACSEVSSPLILQVYEPNCDYRGFKYFVNLADFLCNKLEIDVPVALQLDHGHSFESVKAAIEAGFTSVMFDASEKPLEDNIHKSVEVVKFAHNRGVSVEGEVGYVKGNEPPAQSMTGCIEVPERPQVTAVKTNIDEADKYIKMTGVDMLAVNIGTTHGCYKIQDDIDFNLLENLSNRLSVPLVQHGTCGINIELLSKLSKAGMSKINFGEPFRYNYIRYFKELTDSMEHLWHPWKIMREVKNRLKADMIKLIKAIGSSRRAEDSK